MQGKVTSPGTGRWRSEVNLLINLGKDFIFLDLRFLIAKVKWLN